MTKLQVEKIAPTTKNNKQVYKLKWKSDDGKTIKADLTKNNDVKITSKS
jgi:type IV pilus assembly protein PilA